MNIVLQYSVQRVITALLRDVTKLRLVPLYPFNNATPRRDEEKTLLDINQAHFFIQHLVFVLCPVCRPFNF